jgi:hypothetical protein
MPQQVSGDMVMSALEARPTPAPMSTPMPESKPAPWPALRHGPTPTQKPVTTSEPPPGPLTTPVPAASLEAVPEAVPVLHVVRRTHGWSSQVERSTEWGGDPVARETKVRVSVPKSTTGFVARNTPVSATVPEAVRVPAPATVPEGAPNVAAVDGRTPDPSDPDSTLTEAPEPERMHMTGPVFGLLVAPLPAPVVNAYGRSEHGQKTGELLAPRIPAACVGVPGEAIIGGQRDGEATGTRGGECPTRQGPTWTRGRRC